MTLIIQNNIPETKKKPTMPKQKPISKNIVNPISQDGNSL